MNGTKKLAALVLACIMVAAVGVPIVYGADVAAAVSGKSPVINSITFSGSGVSGTEVSLTPGPSAITTTEVEITAVIYCQNGPNAIDVVTADISPLIEGYSESITMTEDTTDPSAHTADYITTIDIPSNTAKGDYTVTVTATHTNAGVDPGTGYETLTVLATVAIEDVGSVDFGTDLEPGGEPSNQTVQVTNWGNVDITIIIAPGELSNGAGGTISGDCITTTWDSGTTIAVDNGASVPVTLTVPDGTPEGTYTGTIVFTPAEA